MIEVRRTDGPLDTSGHGETELDAAARRSSRISREDVAALLRRLELRDAESSANAIANRIAAASPSSGLNFGPQELAFAESLIGEGAADNGRRTFVRSLMEHAAGRLLGPAETAVPLNKIARQLLEQETLTEEEFSAVVRTWINHTRRFNREDVGSLLQLGAARAQHGPRLVPSGRPALIGPEIDLVEVACLNGTSDHCISQLLGKPKSPSDNVRRALEIAFRRIGVVDPLVATEKIPNGPLFQWQLYYTDVTSPAPLAGGTPPTPAA